MRNLLLFVAAAAATAVRLPAAAPARHHLALSGRGAAWPLAQCCSLSLAALLFTQSVPVALADESQQQPQAVQISAQQSPQAAQEPVRLPMSPATPEEATQLAKDLAASPPLAIPSGSDLEMMLQSGKGVATSPRSHGP